MTNGKDPFDLDDEDRTIIQRPDPGGRRTAVGPGGESKGQTEEPENTIILGGAASQSTNSQTSPLQDAAARSVSGSVVPIRETDDTNPLVAASARLLALAGVLRGAANHNDVAGLRQMIVRELEDYEKAADSKGAESRDTQLGHYVLCSLIDDVVMSTPWGGQQGWSARSLTSAFHNQVDSGEKLYELAARLLRSPGEHHHVVELIYLALSLGFEGRYRIEQQGPAKHAKVRDSLFNLIRERREIGHSGLSKNWHGIKTEYQPLVRKIPLWVFGAGLSTIALLIYFGFLFILGRESDVALRVLHETRLAAVATPSEVFEQLPIGDDVQARVAEILAPDIAARLVSIENFPGQIDITIINQEGMELFGPARATISSGYRATLERLAEATDVTGANVFVRGYSDSQSIRSAKYSSNWELSDARAESVHRVLSSIAERPERISSQGFGPEDPLADNSTAEGRRKNRRVEVTLQKPLGNR